MSFSPGTAFFPLMQHVNEVARAGVDLGEGAAADWDAEFDPDVLLAILILHGLDKPLLYGRRGGAYAALPRAAAWRDRRHAADGAGLRPYRGQHGRSACDQHALTWPEPGGACAALCRPLRGRPRFPDDRGDTALPAEALSN